MAEVIKAGLAAGNNRPDLLVTDSARSKGRPVADVLLEDAGRGPVPPVDERNVAYQPNRSRCSARPCDRPRAGAQVAVDLPATSEQGRGLRSSVQPTARPPKTRYILPRCSRSPSARSDRSGLAASPWIRRSRSCMRHPGSGEAGGACVTLKTQEKPELHASPWISRSSPLTVRNHPGSTSRTCSCCASPWIQSRRSPSPDLTDQDLSVTLDQLKQELLRHRWIRRSRSCRGHPGSGEAGVACVTLDQEKVALARSDRSGLERHPGSR